MAANLDVYMLTDKSVFHGQQCLNVYFYQRNSVVATVFASQLSDDYIANVLPSVLAIQNAEVLHTEISVKNLFDVSDNHTESISEIGTYSASSADTLGNFEAVAFQLIGNNGAVRNGSKRYAGIDEAVQQDGVLTNTTYVVDLMGDLAEKIADALQVGIVDTFFPVIVKRLLVGTDYVLPTVLADAVISGITQALGSVLITSQTSRKQGVGV